MKAMIWVYFMLHGESMAFVFKEVGFWNLSRSICERACSTTPYQYELAYNNEEISKETFNLSNLISIAYNELYQIHPFQNYEMPHFDKIVRHWGNVKSICKIGRFLIYF